MNFLGFNKNKSSKYQANKPPMQNEEDFNNHYIMQSIGVLYMFTFRGRLENLLYTIGFDVEYAAIKLWRNSQVLFWVLLSFLKDFLSDVKIRCKKSLFGFFMVFAHPFITLARSIKTVFFIIVEERSRGAAYVFKSILDYVKEGVKKHALLSTRPLNYILPILALGMFIYTAQTLFSYSFVLEVKSDGVPLGYVPSEAVGESAKQGGNDRIIYDDNEDAWAIEPTYSIKIADNIEDISVTEDELQLANAIILNSGEEIQESTGIYVDGVFYGATTDKIGIEDDLEGLLAPYHSDDPNVTVEFIRDVEVQDGIYLQTSLVDYESLSNVLTGTTGRNASSYIIQEDETLEEILEKFDMTEDEFMSLNSGFDVETMAHGDSVTIMRDESFLGVQVVEEIIYEEEIPYETVRENSADIILGTVSTETEGENGINQITAKITKIDGVEVEREIISTVVTKEPVNELLLVGTAIGNTGVAYDPSSGSYPLLWPTGGGVYVSRGWLGLYVHRGVDIAGPAGTPIYAAE